MIEGVCAISGCEASTKRGHLMCLRHWRMVPRDEAREVNDCWRDVRRVRQSGDPVGVVARYRAAVMAARDSVEAKSVLEDS